ncbi:SRPBCC family protein [Amycolatopsis jejuensis]|uniref:SRPBCC family protein n=1 Tax=Amycolatopsis jejuensis TaxID=330084 RepID=UPI0005277404|nr:SRPBCC domain-containing protein [Amycolatopsis jejuensis]
MTSDLTIVRVFDAPRDLVFRAWTDADQLANWLGPEKFLASEVVTDPRPGGAWKGRIRSEEYGVDRRMSGVYREVTPPSRLVFTYRWDVPDDEVGETVITVTLADLDGKTEMTFHQTPFPNEAEQEGHRYGWMSAFEDLTRSLAAVR